jgi:CBS domain-containing protein
MAKEVRTIERNDKLSSAENLMKERRIRHLPVVDENGRLAGIISAHDLAHAALSSAMGFGEKANEGFLDTVVAKEIMTDEPVTIAPDEDVRTAAGLMVEHKVGCLPVLENGRLVGLLTESDLLRYIVES